MMVGVKNREYVLVRAREITSASCNVSSSIPDVYRGAD